MKLIFSILISYPLAAALKRIPDSKPAFKNLFITGYGVQYSREYTRDSLFEPRAEH